MLLTCCSVLGRHYCRKKLYITFLQKNESLNCVCARTYAYICMYVYKNFINITSKATLRFIEDTMKYETAIDSSLTDE